MSEKSGVWRKAHQGLAIGTLLAVLTACAAANPTAPPTTPALLPATPASEAFQVNDVASEGARLRVTVPAVTVLAPPADRPVQLFLVLADPSGTYSYLVYPANRPGSIAEQFDLSAWPLEITLQPESAELLLWVLAVTPSRYQATESYGVQALAASLGIGFREWLSTERDDDPLATIVSNSAGALFEWFASTEVIGQALVTLHATDGWSTGMSSQRSEDGKLNVVLDVVLLSATEVASLPTPSAAPGPRDYVLVADETFSGEQSQLVWYEGQDRTFRNQVVEGAYEIQLTEIVQRDYALSWGSIENARFADYRVEASVRLVEDGVQDGRYGLWFHYQDDFNFIYFGISNDGRYRVAVVLRNANRREIQDWTPHPAIQTGAATNTLTIEATVNGEITLGINGEDVATFTDRTFSAGSLAFFCYARSVPATCRLERLRIWERHGS
ncbi:MAG: hypothetical protein Kow00106_02990 [Anaerolineae bacterium]